MRKILILIIALVLPSGFGYTQTRGKVEAGKFTSEILGVEKEYSVYLPAGYDESAKEYPVLYLLHGAWGTHKDWINAGHANQVADRMVSEGTILPMIIVMPDASGELPDNSGSKMGYYNRPGWNYEDFFFQEFIPYVESAYRVNADKKYRAISGLSMGGGGAMIYGLRYPDMFGSVCPLSGMLTGVRGSGSVGSNELYYESVKPHDAVEYISNASEDKLDAYRTVRWYIDCGDDDHLYEANVQTYVAMRKKKVPLQYRMRDGAHDWLYWQSALPDILRFISIGFAE